jgi:DNA-binding PadR family transcriptional regulator
MSEAAQSPSPTGHEPAASPPGGSDDAGAATPNTLHAIILGLVGARPMSGYDIKRAFDRSLASYWNAGNSQIYTALKALAARGLVTSDLIAQRSRPDRRVYRLTPAGRAALDRWLGEPVPARFTKDEFLARLFFMGEASDTLALAHLESHRTAILAQLAHMEWVLREYGGRATRRPRLLEYQMLVRDYKQELLQADLRVTERAIARVRERVERAGPGIPGTDAGAPRAP